MNNYDFLDKIQDLPRIVKIGLSFLGTREIKGEKHNATILSWAKETGLDKVYSSDEIAWCGLFIAMVVKRSGREPVESPLWARNWAKWEVKADKAMLGDILAFKRNSGGHVGIYIAEDKDCYHVLGGNQSDAVTITRIEKSRCIGIRRPVYQNQPESVKQYFVKADGQISTNEA
jgi:uncharacterized protein (TIGR02594 family)